jgi:hypothetical protein
MKTDYAKLQDPPREPLQLDQAGLDFGNCRIMNQRNDGSARAIEEGIHRLMACVEDV